MRAILNVGGLAKAVAHVVRFMDKDRPFVRLDADGDRVTVTASNGSQWSSAWVDARVADAGSHAVNGLWLAALTRAMPNGEVTLEDDAAAGRNYVVLRGADATLRMRFVRDDVAPGPVSRAPEQYPVDADAFSRMVSSVSYLAGVDRNTPILSAVRLTGEGGALKAVATNRMAASRRSIPAKTLEDGTAVPVVPDGQWLVDGQWLNDNRANVTAIGFTDTLFEIDTPDSVDVTALVDGVYPPRVDSTWWDEADRAASIRVDRRDLIAAVSMLEKVNFNSGALVVPLRFRTVNGKLRIEFDGLSDDTDSSGFRLLDAEIENTPEFKVDVKLILAALKVMDGDDAIILVNPNPRGPLILKQDEGDLSQVIVPLRA